MLFALGLAGVGSVTAEALAAHFGSIEELIAAQPEAITEVDGVGPILAEQVAEQLGDERTADLIARLRGARPAASSSTPPSGARTAARSRARPSS